MAKKTENAWENNFNCYNDIYDQTNFINVENAPPQRRMLPPLPLQSNNADFKLPVINLNDRIVKTAPIWFQPKITKEEVEEILNKFKTGIFIIRLNSLSDNIVLSFKAIDKVSHLKIKINQKRGIQIDGSSNVFTSINDLVYHYMTNNIQEPGIKLIFPAIIMESFHSNHFIFFENMKLDFWITNVSQLKLNDVFFDSPIENNFYLNEKKKMYDSTVSLPEKVNKDKRRNLFSSKACTVEMNGIGLDYFSFFRKLKSLLNKAPSPKINQPNISQIKRGLPCPPKLPSDLDHFNFTSELANDFDDYYDE